MAGKNTDWCDDYANVLRLARWLVEEWRVETAREMLDYFSAPWKWTTEWNEMQEGCHAVC